MRIKNYKNIYFIGIGGIGMSAIARYFNSIGKNVFGYDRMATQLTAELTAEGIGITFQEDVDQIPARYQSKYDTLVVYTPAIPANHPQLIYFQQQQFEIMKRSQVLGLLSDNLNGIGIAGTHGKTTVSTITAHIFKTSALDCNAFLGGISRNYQSNLLLSKTSPWMILEADEFDRSFLQLHPQLAVVTSMDADHLDIYGNKNELEKSFQAFVYQIKEGGILVYKKGLILTHDKLSAYTYSLEEKADFYAENIKLVEGFYQFDLVYPDGIIKDLLFSYPGKINVENAIAASAMALLCGVEADELRKALSTFKGVRRRFDYQIRNEKIVFIDDYAHHPKELWESISSVRELYPEKNITGIFQPHLYSRTRDFAEGFAASLNLLDEVILLDIYPARELPIEGVSSEIILKNLKVPAKLCSKGDLIELLREKEFEVLLTLGAGDIDKLVEPIKNLICERLEC
ncbi:UDP-N-acetylmuramate--L-alanine ligase [Labilibaculum manganireducens]|uniref:UDP-N-acetylmuramate--L-alanine ligase n=1 Tax=Labilibaculum manganireducens TaxID=1940525 RepID=A0A2N3I9S2_9BACT|nr:UDP-N-acetylmuramate--L-alanine ligase [Labilibaculum manganireducens]PKQ67114.1 UDP-N-acetylmuramate--L-alanine ligase [Labilibaculum manganireducens]